MQDDAEEEKQKIKIPNDAEKANEKFKIAKCKMMLKKQKKNAKLQNAR